MGDLRASFRNTLFSQLSLVQTPVDFQTGLYLIDPRISQLDDIQVDQKQLIRRIVSSLRTFQKQNRTASQSFRNLCKKIAEFISSKEQSTQQWKYFLLFLIDEARSESCLYELFPPDQFEELHAHLITLKRPNYYEIGYLHQREMAPLRQEAPSEHEMERLMAKQMFESSTHVQRTQYLFHLLMTYPNDFLQLMKSRLLSESLQYLERSVIGSDRQSQEEQQLEISLLNVQLQRLPVPSRLSRIKRKIQRICKSYFFKFLVSFLCVIVFYMVFLTLKDTKRAIVLISEDETFLSTENLLPNEPKESESLSSVANLINEVSTENYNAGEGSLVDNYFATVEEYFQPTETLNNGSKTTRNNCRIVWKYLHQLKVLIPLSVSLLALSWYIFRAIEHKKECAHHTTLGKHRWFLRSSCPYCQSERAFRRSR
ncbi:hypothetical protein GpartN1_g2020.t1 [Galdieria partita]|uniref:Uncharacterized protein n=1 Tax=Galdieria partita TaxID=83374 RepID=A0A9C7PTN0_9RHOD|nr:hypothetical protein GpartN1_g2020.t1 [Galdieria partita]